MELLTWNDSGDKMTTSNPLNERLTDLAECAAHQEFHCAEAAIQAARPTDAESNATWRKVLESEAKK